MNKPLNFRNELLLILCLIAVISLTKLATISRVEAYLWLSLAAILSASAVFAISFFKQESAGTAMVGYLITGALLVTYFALIYRNFQISDNVTSTIAVLSWEDAFYLSLVTWTTLGYGDYSPLGNARLWAVVEAMIGYFYMALLASKLISLAQTRTK